MSDWKKICALTDIPQLGSRVVKSEKHGDIAIFRTSDDDVFAVHDKCPHKQGPLSQGIVHGKTVTCPLHSWKIELDTGNAGGDTLGRAARFGAGLGIEGVHVGHTPGHVEEDTMFGLAAAGRPEGLGGADGQDAYAEGGFGGARHKLAAAQLVESIQCVFHDFLRVGGDQRRGYGWKVSDDYWMNMNSRVLTSAQMTLPMA